MKEIARILELPIPERIQLVEAIWDSIVEVPESVPVSDELKCELDRRLDEYYQNPDAVRPWEAIKKDLLSRGCLLSSRPRRERRARGQRLAG